MKNLETLINELCPEGVEFVKLGDVFELFSGMSKVSNKWAEKGNCKFIDYLNIYNNLNVDVNKLQNATVASFKQNVLKQGDILFTCASETPRECAISAVIREPIADNTFLDDHLNGIRVKKEVKDKVNPAFVNYYFYSPNFRIAICKIVRGVTRFYIVNKNFLKIEIPLPPIEVQTEIVRILDKFTSLEAELEAELDCRKRQYEYYRDKLLSFENVGGQNVEWKKMSEVGTFIRGNGLQKKDFTEAGVGCIHYGQLYTHYGTSATKTITYCSPELATKLRKASKGDVVIATTSENVEDVCKAVAWLGDNDVAVSGDAFIYKHNQNPKYMAYLFQTLDFFNYKKKKATGTKVIRLSGDAMGNYLAPIPPLAEQERIVSILDRFESLTTSLTAGLPAEIAARRQQYEHYRDKLLTFKRKTA